ncbi:MAG: cupin domain-containing protein [bacterium]
MSSNNETDVDVIKAEDINHFDDTLERHPGIQYKELIGPESEIPSIGSVIGIYDATVHSGKSYWPRANEQNVDRIVYVEKGQGRLSIGDDKYTIRSGDLARIHQGREKEAEVNNTGESPLKLLVIILEVSS